MNSRCVPWHFKAVDGMWDQRYDTDEFVFGEEPNTFLEENFAVLPKGRVLCLAEGEGRNAVFLARHGYEVTGVDSLSVGLAKGRRLADRHGVAVDWVHADLAEYELGRDRWDGIVSIFCHLPPDLRGHVFGQVVTGLKPGGVLLLEPGQPGALLPGRRLRDPAPDPRPGSPGRA